MKLLLMLLVLIVGMSKIAGAQSLKPRVKLETNYGVMVLELDAQAAPKTVENFLTYARDGFYDGTIFHRVIAGFMIQGGGFTKDMKQKETNAPIQNEADNQLKNARGTIAMARTSDPHSATGQFFINSVDNTFLDFKAKSAQGWGYCVFGKVVEGLEVVDKIEQAATTIKSGMKDVPAETIEIQKATVLE